MHPDFRFRLPGPAQLRGLAALVILVCFLDWTLKGFFWWGGVPHETHRSMLILLGNFSAVFLLLSMMPGPLIVWGGGLLVGGTAANLIDVNIDGVAWNMIPTLTDWWVNLADVCLFSGLVLLVVGTILYISRAWRSGQFVASSSPADLH